jgi:hypothetical protein
LFVPEPSQEESQENDRTADKTNDGSRSPGVDGTTPLERQEKHDDGGTEEEEAGEVEAVEFLAESDGTAGGGVVEEEKRGNGHRAEGEIDIEA